MNLVKSFLFWIKNTRFHSNRSNKILPKSGNKISPSNESFQKVNFVERFHSAMSERNVTL